jgi:DNA polymerase-3 subunit epsilon
MQTKISTAIKNLESNGYKIMSPLPTLAIGAKFGKDAANTLNVLYMDCETTGLSLFADEVIEAGFILAKINADTAELIEVLDVYQGFNEPLGASISASAQATHGLTDSDVKGHKLDLERIVGMVKQCDIACSHNAAFDRPMLEKAVEELTQVRFTCSLAEVDWEFESKKLRYIVMELGYHFNGHRAIDDAWAGLWALNCKDKNGVRYMKSLIEKLDDNVVDVIAVRSPFSAKNFLYDNGYSFFDGNGKKYWHKVVTDAEVLDELQFLRDEIYVGESIDSEAQLNWLSRYDRFSKRITKTEFIKIMV